jgi:hypothetical protein
MKHKRLTQRAVAAKAHAAEPLTDRDRRILGDTSPSILVGDTPTDAQIATLAERALDAFAIAGAAVEQTLLAKAEAGRALRAKRADLDHGDWLPWLDSMIPKPLLQREQDGLVKSAADAWRREVRRWIDISLKFERVPAAALERAHTVRQLLQLADFIPEGETLPGAQPETAEPEAIVARVGKWWMSQAALLNPQSVKSWPAKPRAELAESLKPAADLYRACCEAAA